jgi:hypothetical protein
MRETAEGERSSKRDDPDRAHLAGVEDGCGCVEVWEHLSEGRDD